LPSSTGFPNLELGVRSEKLGVRRISLISPRMMIERGHKPDRFSYQRVKTG